MTTGTAKSEPMTYEFKNLPRFPITLFHFNKYDGGKALVAGFFLIASIYFFTGFFGFLIDHNAWLKDLIYGSPNYEYIPIKSAHWWEVWKYFWKSRYCY
jgi:hypothetical protein